MSDKVIRSHTVSSTSVAKFRSPVVGDLRQLPRPVVVFKVACDVFFSIMALPLIAFFAVLLSVLNPLFNRGPLFFGQERMGKNQTKFTMWKFRTMVAEKCDARAHDAVVEEHRITKLGRFLRRTRIDELPNFINVILGQMSVIGPRPDMWEHSKEYLTTVPDYRERFRLRPGISGLAQIRNGYADCSDSIRRKARLDRLYVERFDIRMELYIIWQTFAVMFTGDGAK